VRLLPQILVIRHTISARKLQEAAFSINIVQGRYARKKFADPDSPGALCL